MDVGFFSLHCVVLGYALRCPEWKGWHRLLDDLANENNA